jgi:hypothetical protein
MKNNNLKFVYITILFITLILGEFFTFSKKVNAQAILSPNDFTIWNQGGIIGYDAGFLITGTTFNNASSIVIQLYSGNNLLQTNTAVSGKITGNSFLTPFDVSGTFDYNKDGYFTNVKQAEYGKNLKPTKVTATITLSDGTVFKAENTNLTNEPTQAGQVLGVKKYFFTQSLKIGSKGNDVTELQKLLASTGYETGSADGYFGSITKKAVIKFQGDNKLFTDGLVGPHTLKVLNK